MQQTETTTRYFCDWCARETPREYLRDFWGRRVWLPQYVLSALDRLWQVQLCPDCQKAPITTLADWFAQMNADEAERLGITVIEVS